MSKCSMHLLVQKHDNFSNSVFYFNFPFLKHLHLRKPKNIYCTKIFIFYILKVYTTSHIFLETQQQKFNKLN